MNFLADYATIALVVGMSRNSSIAQQCLWTRGRNFDLAIRALWTRPIHKFVPDVP